MSNTSLHNSPSKEQVLGWIEKYQQTENEEAQTKLVIHYTKLVESIAWKYSSGKSYHEDMVQVGMLGLLGAIRRYDSSIGKKFEAFAIPTIMGEIKRFLRDQTWAVHVPRRVKELGPRIRAAVEVLTIELQRSPLVTEIADYLMEEVENVLEAMEMGQSYQTLSMDQVLGLDSGDSTTTLFDIIGEVDSEFEETDHRLVVASALNVLNEREKEIIQLTYMERLAQREVGERVGISQVHVSRIQRKAIKKLQEAILVLGRSEV